MASRSNLDLARRAVAAAGWTPHCSALGSPGVRVPESGVLWRPHGEPFISLEWLPDLDDPATLGCLRALVRQAWRDPLLRTEGYPDGWRVVWWEGSRLVGLGGTEAEALVAALEAAPVRP